MSNEEQRNAFEHFIVRAGFTDWKRLDDGYLKPLVDRLWRAWPSVAATPPSPIAGRELVIASQQELFALREWKGAILGKCKASDGFDALEWGGDKEGWGFVHYFIGHLETRALRPEPAATAASEPVAWRWRYKNFPGDMGWIVMPTEPKGDGIDVQPLYCSVSRPQQLPGGGE